VNREILWRSGQWTDAYDESSSNWKDLGNIVQALESLYKDQGLMDVGICV
jgi:hypothetical protein